VVEQLGDEVSSDEAGRAGHEVRHAPNITGE
jgi:hypothetical protein